MNSIRYSRAPGGSQTLANPSSSRWILRDRAGARRRHRPAGANLASESGRGARSAASGGEAPRSPGARFGSRSRSWLGRGAEEEEEEEEREAGGRERGERALAPAVSSPSREIGRAHV